MTPLPSRLGAPRRTRGRGGGRCGGGRPRLLCRSGCGPGPGTGPGKARERLPSGSGAPSYTSKSRASTTSALPAMADVTFAGADTGIDQQRDVLDHGREARQRLVAHALADCPAAAHQRRARRGRPAPRCRTARRPEGGPGRDADSALRRRTRRRYGPAANRTPRRSRTTSAPMRSRVSSTSPLAS